MSRVKKIIRRLRGVLGSGVLWGGLGTLLGSLGGVAAGLAGVAPLGEAVVAGAVGVGFIGAILGTGFAAALSLADGHRTLENLSPRRAALWGGLVGGAIPVVMLLAASGSVVGVRLAWMEYLLALVTGAVVYGAVGSGLAAGSVAIAKRADVLGRTEGAAQLGDGDDD